MKTEVINFQDFMKNNHVKSQVKNQIIAHSPAAIGLVLGSSLIVPQKYILLGYGLVLGIGGLAYLLAKFENKWVQNGMHKEADRIANLGKFLFPVIVIGIGVYLLIFKNPLMDWIL